MYVLLDFLWSWMSDMFTGVACCSGRAIDYEEIQETRDARRRHRNDHHEAWIRRHHSYKRPDQEVEASRKAHLRLWDGTAS